MRQVLCVSALVLVCSPACIDDDPAYLDGYRSIDASPEEVSCDDDIQGSAMPPWEDCWSCPDSAVGKCLFEGKPCVELESQENGRCKTFQWDEPFDGRGYSCYCETRSED